MTTKTREEEALRLIHFLRDTDREDDEVAHDEAEVLLGTDPLTYNFTQDEAVDFINSSRDSSWDIPSALIFICDHHIVNPGSSSSWPDDFPMHRSSLWPENDRIWDLIDQHFKDIHFLDLSDPRINWDFDT